MKEYIRICVDAYGEDHYAIELPGIGYFFRYCVNEDRRGIGHYWITFGSGYYDHISTHLDYGNDIPYSPENWEKLVDFANRLREVCNNEYNEFKKYLEFVV